MLEILIVTFPFFALVLAGYIAGYRRMLPLTAIPGLNTFVLFFALPCMLFRFGASTPIAQLLDLPLFLIYAICAVIMVIFTISISLSSHIRWNDASFGALVAAFPNTGFMGIPLLVALFGQAAAGPAIVTILADMFITTSLCIGLSRLDGAEEHGASRAIQKALKGVLANPMPWAIAAGCVVSAMQLQVALPINATIGLLADAASPVALFTIGAVLARSTLLAQQNSDHSVEWIDFVPIALIKLLLHPLLVLLAAVCVKQWGWPLSDFAITIMVLVAALPSASNVSLLAERFGANNGRIARIILVSTALAFPSFSALVAILKN
ncbi:MAG: AEC family transporter [Burkholderiaceae bacterium]